jgi:HK97 family phage prohead protease
VNRPKPGSVEERTAPIEGGSAPTIDGRKLRSMIPYNTESCEMPGGWREVIDRGAVDADTRLADLIATREHSRAHLLGRHPTTLTTEDRADGFHWAADLPSSPVGEDVRVAVERGDLRSSSWRMVVAKDYWEGDVRHVAKIAELLDVTVTAAPAYAAAAAELRSQPDPAEGQEDTMAETTAETAATTATETTTATNTAAEDRSTTTTSGLQVEDRVTVANTSTRGLADEFRAMGFPSETATIDFDTYEDRAVTWTGSVDNINKVQATAGNLGADRRWAWPAFARVNIDAGATSVDVFTQTARTLATPATVVRAIDAVTAKPETASTLTIVTTALKQVASIYTNVPNIQLEQPAFNTVIEQDLTLAPQRRPRQAGARLHRYRRLPSPGHRPAARLDPQGDDDDHGQRVRAGHAAVDAGQRGGARRARLRYRRRRQRLRVRAGELRARPDLRAQPAREQGHPGRGRCGLPRVGEALHVAGAARQVRG